MCDAIRFISDKVEAHKVCQIISYLPVNKIKLYIFRHEMTVNSAISTFEK